ncbi:MAG TPA: DUF177 domain-containing protein [Patescibacteria group bacterium]|nr:DUF177 domain-containing protein [Patescibacteria group bacterium]
MTVPADALLVNVAGLLGEAPGARREVDVVAAEVALGDDLVAISPVTVRARVARTNRGVIVKGRARVDLADICGRCLVPLSIPIDAAIEEEVLPLIDLQSGLRLDTTADPEVLRLSDHHELDLEPLAREAIQLAAPIAPVCRPECRGLCPGCGLDLNAQPHDHGAAAVDPRLAILGELRIDDEG